MYRVYKPTPSILHLNLRAKVLLTLGESYQMIGEAKSVTQLRLPEAQQNLAEAVAKARLGLSMKHVQCLTLQIATQHSWISSQLDNSSDWIEVGNLSNLDGHRKGPMLDVWVPTKPDHLWGVYLWQSAVWSIDTRILLVYSVRSNYALGPH